MTFFEIPALLSCKQRNPEQENSKQHIYIVEFSALFYAEFSHSKDKRAGISKKKSCHSLSYFYT